MVWFIVGSGAKENRMVKDMNFRLMGQNILESTWTVPKMVAAYTPGKTNRNILGSGKIILSMGMGSIYGWMEEVSVASGKRGRCMGTGNISGTTVSVMRVNIKMIKNTALGYTLGPMVEYIRATGNLANRMALQNTM